jgi:tRNA-dihydrouridine synthase
MTSQQKIIGLAPMDWITNCAYRIITKELFDAHNSQTDHTLWMWTEFMNVEWFMREPGRLIHHIMKTDFEDQTIAQIYGADNHDLVETAKFIDSYDRSFSGIELNIWCPSPKVMSCGGGAGMMRDRPRTTAIIKDIANTTSLPFSIKTRAGLSVEDKIDQKAFILDVAPYCRHIIIHGRTYKQSHTGDVDWQFIYDIKRELGDTCIIIWNGGIRDYDDMIQHFSSDRDIRTTLSDENVSLDGIMVWQAAIWRPWLFMNHTPTLSERYNLILRHAQMMIILYDYYFSRVDMGRTFLQPTYAWLLDQLEHFAPEKYDHEKTMIEYRKYLFNYISGLPGNRELKVQLATTKDYSTMMWYVEHFFATLHTM